MEIIIIVIKIIKIIIIMNGSLSIDVRRRSIKCAINRMKKIIIIIIIIMNGGLSIDVMMAQPLFPASK
mgnify:FL=1|jgi:hypothetical protein